jgi:hypothetical protein
MRAVAYISFSNRGRLTTAYGHAAPFVSDPFDDAQVKPEHAAVRMLSKMYKVKTKNMRIVAKYRPKSDAGLSSFEIIYHVADRREKLPVVLPISARLVDKL